MKNIVKVQSPTKVQQFVLRLMIIIGVCCAFFLCYTLFDKNVADNPVLYWLLMITFIFTCFKVIYEWYHYWSITVPQTPPLTKRHTVDIFTTFCAGEPYEMIVETLTAIQAITYPHVAYLCDEANDQYLKTVCAQLGVHHVTRTNKVDAKAGNINNALKISNGELCVVLDPDHVPAPDFLDPIVSHFDNQEIGFVQIVQAYSNHDAGWVAKGAAQQTYQFYGPMMMTMNAYGTVQAIGANCTFRRTALESIGYHAAGLAEDMHTAMQLHAKGWKSLYVPAVLTQGLVPATLSAYYKQQLKWSRGVFELLVTSYIKLFTKFTWRQKIHYGLIPLFYLSGFIFLFNFIIPVVSLLADVYPLRMDFSSFFFVSFPFIVSVVLIRHYVQRWVMQENEHGFHVVGGLLLIGTWWVFIVGFVYTIIRKKVPYIPTPKNILEENNFLINIPNFIVFFISLGAIGYGLYNDLNPYNLIMAGMAAVNCGFMFFTYMASQQFSFREYQKSRPVVAGTVQGIGKAKTRFWFLRRRIYSGIRSVAVVLIILALAASFYEIELAQHPPARYTAIAKKRMFLSGIFEPADYNGLTSVKRVTGYQSLYQVHFNILSFYISWGDEAKCFVPFKLMDSVYRNGSIPMITWEPWEKLFEHKASKKYGEQKILSRISNGEFDDYIKKIALQLKALNKPVFLRFAHEADNPFYPWSEKGGNTPEDFKSAWKYVRHVFEDAGVYNVIWVWNPWRPYNAEKYFPGKDLVDWIGVTGLNFGSYNDDGKQYSFRQLYSPYHNLPLMRNKLPVMVAEMGTLQQNGDQDKWFTDATKCIDTEFKEIKSVILFNTALDKNVPGNTQGLLNWQLWQPRIMQKIFASSKTLAVANYKIAGQYTLNHSAITPSIFNNMRGVNYTTRQNWGTNIFPLTKKVIEKDFAGMAKTGINTVKITGPSIYDHSTFKIAERQHIKIVYGFWMPDAVYLINSKNGLSKLADDILATVRSNKNNANIIAWNFGNNTLQQLAQYYDKPLLSNEQQKYISWLAGLIRSVREADPVHAITVDVSADAALTETITALHEQVPEIDAFGLQVPADQMDTAKLARLKVPYFFSSIKATAFLRFKPEAKGAFVGEWQDQQTKNGITFNGLNDTWNRHKPELYKLSKYWNGQIAGDELPPLKILVPALTTEAGASLPYHALVYTGGQWSMADKIRTGMHFEWYLTKTDDRGTPLSIKFIGTGADINVIIPADDKHYKIFLTGIKDSEAITVESTLNLPL